MRRCARSAGSDPLPYLPAVRPGARRVVKVLVWIAGTALAVASLELPAGWALQAVQTTLMASPRRGR